MSTSSQKWSRKSARRANGVRNAAFAAAATALLAACGGGGGDASIGLPPAQGPINWGAVQTLASNASAATAPAATIDSNGLASVLWSQIGMPLAGGGTSAVPLVGVADSGSGTAFGPALAIEQSGTFSSGDSVTDLAARAGANNTAAWRRQLASNAGVQIGSASREAGGWGIEYYPSIRPGSALVQEFSYAVNAGGTRVAVWTEADSLFNGVRRVQLSVRSGSAGWSQAQPISGTTQDASQPSVTVDSAGMAMVVWRQGVAPGIVRARSYDTTAGQLGGNELSVDPGQFVNDMRNPRVVALGPGSFLATWEQAGGGGAYDMRANTGSAAAWQVVSATLDLGAGTVDQSRLVPGPNATAYAVWRQNDAIHFARYTAASGNWSVARQANGGQTGASREPRVAVDGNGNAIFVWLQTPAGGGPDDLFYATFTASNGAISGAFQLDAEATGAAAAPSLSVAPNGAAVVAWLQSVANQANPNVVARVFRP